MVLKSLRDKHADAASDDDFVANFHKSRGGSLDITTPSHTAGRQRKQSALLNQTQELRAVVAGKQEAQLNNVAAVKNNKDDLSKIKMLVQKCLESNKTWKAVGKQDLGVQTFVKPGEGPYVEVKSVGIIERVHALEVFDYLRVHNVNNDQKRKGVVDQKSEQKSVCRIWLKLPSPLTERVVTFEQVAVRLPEGSFVIAQKSVPIAEKEEGGDSAIVMDLNLGGFFIQSLSPNVVGGEQVHASPPSERASECEKSWATAVRRRRPSFAPAWLDPPTSSFFCARLARPPPPTPPSLSTAARRRRLSFAPSWLDPRLSSPSSQVR